MSMWGLGRPRLVIVRTRCNGQRLAGWSDHIDHKPQGASNRIACRRRLLKGYLAHTMDNANATPTKLGT